MRNQGPARMNAGFCGGGCSPVLGGGNELEGAGISKGLPLRSPTRVSVAVRIIFVPPASQFDTNTLEPSLPATVNKRKRAVEQPVGLTESTFTELNGITFLTAQDCVSITVTCELSGSLPGA